MAVIITDNMLQKPLELVCGKNLEMGPSKALESHKLGLLDDSGGGSKDERLTVMRTEKTELITGVRTLWKLHKRNCMSHSAK